jgi:superfamily II DNA/RNA helicase
MMWSDLVTRGLGIPNVSNVINFNLPINGNGGYDACACRLAGQEEQCDVAGHIRSGI